MDEITLETVQSHFDKHEAALRHLALKVGPATHDAIHNILHPTVKESEASQK